MLKLVCSSNSAARRILFSINNRPSPGPVLSFNRCCRCDSLKLHSNPRSWLFCGESEATCCSTLRNRQSCTIGINAPGATLVHLAAPLLTAGLMSSRLADVVLDPFLLAED